MVELALGEFSPSYNLPKGPAMSSRARFTCQSITKTHGCKAVYESDGSWHNEPAPIYAINLTAVTSNDPGSEEAAFFASTPSGEINIGVVNEKAAEQFEPGKDYYVVFSPVPAG